VSDVIRGKTPIWSLVSVFEDKDRRPWHEVHSSSLSLRDSVMSSCFACRYSERAAEAFVDHLFEHNRAELQHEDGSPYCTMYLQWVVVR
jgi:hypothetical protein